MKTKSMQEILEGNPAAFTPGSPTSRNTDLSNEKITRLKWQFMDVAARIRPGFLVQDAHKELYNDIFRWCLMLDGRLNPGKGLWLYGNVGTGKSTMLWIVKEFCKVVRPPKPDGFPYSFRISNAVDVCGDFQREGFEGIKTYIESDWQAFDEVGSESKVVGYYGTPQNVFQHILQCRYDNRHRNTTHITTNLSIQQISERYSPRIYDRCKEMFNFVEFNGKTFRK